MNMGLLARNLQDLCHEGVVITYVIHCWRFLFLHYKAKGHTKYTLEAFQLIADLEVMLSARRVHELKWNWTYSVHGGVGCNIPLDLQMEHLHRAFKANIFRFSSHIFEATVKVEPYHNIQGKKPRRNMKSISCNPCMLYTIQNTKTVKITPRYGMVLP